MTKQRTFRKCPCCGSNLFEERQSITVYALGEIAWNDGILTPLSEEPKSEEIMTAKIYCSNGCVQSQMLEQLGKCWDTHSPVCEEETKDA